MIPKRNTPRKIPTKESLEVFFHKVAFRLKEALRTHESQTNAIILLTGITVIPLTVSNNVPLEQVIMISPTWLVLAYISNIIHPIPIPEPRATNQNNQ